MMLYQQELDAYMAKTTPDRYMIETSFGLEAGLDPRPRFFCATCQDCHMIVDVLPARMVTPEQRKAWWDAMDRRQLHVSARMARSRWQEGNCTCEEGHE